MEKQIELFVKNLKSKGNSSTLLICAQGTKNQKELADFIAQRILGIKDEQSLVNNPDIFRVERRDKQSIGIEKIHEFIRMGQFKPFSNQYKIGIVYEAFRMTREAQNALLKIAEEPPANTFIILTCTRSSQLIPTLVSRCKVFVSNKSEDAKDSNLGVRRVLSSSLYDRFLLVEEIISLKDKSVQKEKIRLFLEDLLKFFRILFLKEKSLDGKIIKSIELIELTQKALDSNVNTRLALENLFINLPTVRAGGSR